MSNEMLDQMLNSTSDIALCWLGNLSWLVAGQGRLIAVDLDLDHELRLQPSPNTAQEIAEVLDVLFITNEHGDHFNAATAAVLTEKSDCFFVVPANCKTKAMDIGVPDSRIKIARPGLPFELAGLHVHPIRALHGDRKHAVYRHANLDDCGYVLTMAGKRLLQPGDSILLQDHLDLNDINILFVSPTEHNTHIEASVTLIMALNPDYIFPQHFDTYRQTPLNAYWTKGYPDAVKEMLPQSLQERFHKLSQGEVFFIESN